MPATSSPRGGIPATLGAPAPIRVLLVDDSAVMRAILKRVLDPCADIEIVGQASRVPQAIDLAETLAPDLILLDLDMPGMHGLAALPLLAKRAPAARVLIVSAGCGEEAAETVAALRLGAVDTLQKPAGLAVAGTFAETLTDRIRRIARPMPPGPVRVARQPGNGSRPAVVGIAASTGGVHAIGRLLAELPADFDAPILVTQHLPEAFIPYFAAQLQEATGRRTQVGKTGLSANRGEILVAPGDGHLTLARTGRLIHVRLDARPAPSGCRPSADPMFASLAALFGADACGVVLSGMGRDGAVGARALAEAGALVLAQDAASSVIWGMPGTVARAGLATAVLDPEAIAATLAGEGALRPWR